MNSLLIDSTNTMFSFFFFSSKTRDKLARPRERGNSNICPSQRQHAVINLPLHPLDWGNHGALPRYQPLPVQGHNSEPNDQHPPSQPSTISAQGAVAAKRCYRLPED